MTPSLSSHSLATKKKFPWLNLVRMLRGITTERLSNAWRLPVEGWPLCSQQLDALRLLRQEVRRDLLAESMTWKRLRQIPSIGPIRRPENLKTSDGCQLRLRSAPGLKLPCRFL